MPTERFNVSKTYILWMQFTEMDNCIIAILKYAMDKQFIELTLTANIVQCTTINLKLTVNVIKYNNMQ